MKKKRILTRVLAITLAAALLPIPQPIVFAKERAARSVDETKLITAGDGKETQDSALQREFFSTENTGEQNLDMQRAAEQSQEIKASVVGASGNQNGYTPDKCLVSMTGGVSAEGSNDKAAFVAGQTATGTANATGKPLGGTRVGYINFNLDPETDGDIIAKATVTVNIQGVHGQIGDYKTKAGLYQVTDQPNQVDPTKENTYPAKDGDYSYGATVFSDQMFGKDDTGAMTFDVTKIVKAACAEQKDYVSFRLQTVITGFTIWASGDQTPTLKIEKSVTTGASGDQTEAGVLHISSSQAMSAEGSNVQAAFVSEETATGTAEATGAPSDQDRVGYLQFMWEEGLTAGEVGKAAVSLQVTKAEEGMGTYQTKAALFQVDAAADQADPTQEATYPAKDSNYSKEAAIYSNEWIAKDNPGTISFDVTEAIKSAIAEGRHSQAFRLQTVISGFYVSVSKGSGPSLQITNAAEDAKTETSYDLLESIYQIAESKTGKMLVLDGGLKVNADIAQGTETLFGVVRYGDLDSDDSLNNVPVALQAASDNSYFALAKGDKEGTTVKTSTNIADDRSQQFILQKSPNWSKEHLAYKIYHPLSRMYVGYSEAEPYTLQVYGAEAPDYDFIFSRKKYSALGRVRTLPGYQNLSDEEKNRVFDILGGIGPYSLRSFGQSGLTELQSLYDSLASTTAEEQAEKIRTILKRNVFSGQTNWYGLPALPGADGVDLEIKSETYGTYDFWRGTKLNGTKYELVITDDYAAQTINLHVQDQSTAITNGKNAMQALKKIPYPLRKNIRNMYIRNDSANSYNCGANDFYMRTNYVSSVDQVAMYMTHEFGHSMDQVYNVNGSGRWGTARTSDMVGVSQYGSSNNTEDLADFGRLYFQCYGKLNMMYALRQMFPNRYQEYVATLLKTGYTDILLDKIEQIEQGAKKSHLKALLAKAEEKAKKETFYTAETQQALKQAMTQAQTIVDSPDSVQSEVDAAYESLNRALDELEIANKGKIAYFSFDDEDSGFTYGDSAAESKGSVSLVTDAKKGKALKLDGTNSNYLTVTKKDGMPLLSDYNELTVSFWSKVGNTKANWAFYATPEDTVPVYKQENYMGIIDKGTSIEVERYKNTGSRPVVPKATVSQNIWRLVTVVIRKNKTIIFIDGKKEAEEDSSILLSDLLGDHSTFYIGKANWGTGEYFNGLLDEFSIYNYPMTATQVEELFKTEKEPTEEEISASKIDQEKADQVTALIKEIGDVVYSKAVKQKIDEARAAYEALSDAQKTLVGDEIKKLESAEQTYEAAKEEFDQLGRQKIAYFSFDDEESGFSNEYAKAVNKGTPVLEGGKKGKALSLDGKNSNYLTVTSKDGKPLLTAYDEITISYWGKVSQTTAGNWSFFAANNNKIQQSNNEIYAGILDKGNNIEVQRFNNQGQRPASVTGNSAADEWRFISIVISKDKTTLYINGEKSGEEVSPYLLSDILQDNSICYIGRANWQTGEYFKGLIDEYSIYNYALTEKEAADIYKEAEENADKVDLTPLTEKITTAKAIDQGNYTDESYQALQTAIAEAEEAVKTVTTQEEVTEAVNALQTAIDSLKEKEPEGPEDPEKPNLVPLTEKITTAKAIDQGNYTDESYQALQTAIAEAEEAVKTVTTQEEVTEAVNALQTAIDSLKEKEPEGPEDPEKPNLAPLTEKITTAKAIDQGNYTDESYQALQTAIEAAEKAVKTITTQEEVTEAVNALQTAIDSLKEKEPEGPEDPEKPNLTPLTEKITTAKAIDQGNYTDESYQALQTAIEAAEKAVKTITTQEEVTEAVNALQTAIDSLREKGQENPEKPNLTPLTEKITTAKAIDQGNYTDESYQALQTAIAEAEEAVKTVTTQEEVTEAVNALQTAIDNLKEKKPEGPEDPENPEDPEKPNLAPLTEKITTAKAIDQGNYTDESYQALQTAIAEAEEAVKTVTTQEQVTEAVNALQTAIDNLKEKDGNGGSGEIMVTQLSLSPKQKTMKVGQKITLKVTVAPENASNKNVKITSSNSKVAAVSGKKITAKSAGKAIIKVAAEDGSGIEKSITVKVRQKTVTKVKAVQKSTSRYVKVTFGKVKGANGYDIYRSTNAKKGYKKIGRTKKNSFTDKKTKNAKTYYYKVVTRAKKSSYNSVLSSKYAKVKVLARPTVKVKAAKSRKIFVSWKKIKGAKGYVVYTSTKKTKGFKKVKTLKKAKMVKSVIRAKKSVKKLYVKVRPYYTEKGKKIYGPYSNPKIVKVKR